MLEWKGTLVLSTLCRILSRDSHLLPYDFRELVATEPEQARRFVVDVIAGMTNNYAQDYYERLTQAGVGSLSEFL